MAQKQELVESGGIPAQNPLADEPRVKIKIADTEDASAPSEVFVGVQGYGFKIQRGKAVEVPRSVLRVLEEQVKTVYRISHDDQGRQTMIPVNVPAYPYQVMAA